MRYEVNDTFPVAIEGEGTLMDYINQEFVFLIKDEKWTDYEIQAFKRHTLEIDYVDKFDISIFLMTSEDAIDTSDFIFNVHDNEYDETLYESKPSGSGYICCFYLLDADQVIRGRRIVQLSQGMSETIAEHLRKQRDLTYREDEFQCNLEGLQMAWEPFELQEMAIAKETF